MSKKHNNPNPAARRDFAPPATVIKTTPPRNSPIPKAVAAMAPIARRDVSHEMIAKRAYEIFRGGKGGDEMHNWLAAERELKGL